ncbi:hypothetical protein SDC9_202020 [bioreactor metagenome]|uniref:Uncharacterized protein n=1 Tax=bioreactor metagenome TaxID=1076179 RepID=A0A645ITY0_9ZZZZ
MCVCCLSIQKSAKTSKLSLAVEQRNYSTRNITCGAVGCSSEVSS